MRKNERQAWASKLGINQKDQKKSLSPRIRGTKPTTVDGIRFHSKLEADRYQELKLLQRSEEVRYFLRQVPMQVAHGVTYRVDFQIFWNDYVDFDRVSYEDTKGFMTETSRIKIAAVQERYGIQINILNRSDVRRF